MIQPLFFIFHPLPKSLPLHHLHQSLSQHVHSKHQFNTSPLLASPCRLYHCLWIQTHPAHHVPPSLTSCPRQMSLTSQTLTYRYRPVPPKPSTFGKPSTMPRSMPQRHEKHCHHYLWPLSPPASHAVAKHMTLLPHPSHLPCAATVHHQMHLVYATTPKTLMITARILPTCSTNTITGKHTDNMSCRYPRIELLQKLLRTRSQSHRTCMYHHCHWRKPSEKAQCWKLPHLRILTAPHHLQMTSV